MSQEIIKKASEIIKSRTAEENMGVGVSLTLIDKDGYPSTSTISIGKAKGIEELLFGVSLSSNKGKRAMVNSRASVGIFDDDAENGNYYNITLVGDVEIVTDPEVKQDVWYEGLAEHFEHGVNDPDYAVLRFKTKRYNLWLDFGDTVEGTFTAETPLSKPRLEPILIFNNGACEAAMALYQKAFGAVTTSLIRYSESDPQGDLKNNPQAGNLIMNGSLHIGKQSILVCDDITDETNTGNHIQMVLQFDTVSEVEHAYHALLEGATNLMAPHKADYSACVAYLTDTYGIPWQLMVWPE